MENKVKLEILSKSANESFARIAVAAFVSQIDPTIEELADIKTAVSEAVTNSIIHGYEEKEGIIYITCILKNREITIEVKDNGIGIDKEEQLKIFKRFYRCREADSIEGSGIGLYLSKLIMEKQRGYITVDSSKGAGSCFNLYLQNCKN